MRAVRIDLGGVVTVTAPTSAQLADYNATETDAARRTRLKAAVATKRDARLVGGVVRAGRAVPTTLAFRTRVRELVADVTDGAVSVTIEQADGSLVVLTAAQLTALASALRNFVRDCYAAQATHNAAIDAASGAALLAYDIATGWPA